MEEDPFVFAGFLGNIFGLLLNLFLIFVVLFTRKKGQLSDYSLIVLINCVIDVVFASELLFSQHRLVIAEGVLFIFPHGAEKRLIGTNWIALSFFWHLFSPTLTIMALPTLFYYRFTIVSGRSTPSTLAKFMCLSICITLLIASLAALGIHQSNSQSTVDYLAILRAHNLDVKRGDFFVFDNRYPGAMVFTVASISGGTASLNLVLFIIIKTWCFMNSFTNEVRSEQSKSLQRQFTRYLVAQTITGILFSIAPVSFINICIFLNLYANYPFILLPSAYLSVINALLTLLMVGSYRTFVFRMFTNLKSLRSISSIHTSTAT